MHSAHTSAHGYRAAASDTIDGKLSGESVDGTFLCLLCGANGHRREQVPQGPPQPDIRGVGISFDQERDRNGLMRVYVRRIRPGSSAAEVSACFCKCPHHGEVFDRSHLPTKMCTSGVCGHSPSHAVCRRVSVQAVPPINIGDTLVTVGGKNVYGLSLTTLRLLQCLWSLCAVSCACALAVVD